ncbi:hypothetical protein ACWCO0_17730 [Streptomyces tubercidicus]|uniref:hypothetical protein n=1 Tax=Streptomyces tubercidicus TaxID=47759 RepID=UPI0022B79B4A|nr:hypothetical protein [Streptomyces tubercidicus]WAU10239.1 hypothetical protein STRTU_000309 [Streptomyces tubercidicus]
MRIRAAIAASALATTIVMGGASAALACNMGKEHKDRHHHHHYKHHHGHGHHASCWLSAGVLHHVGPVFSEGCERDGWGWGGDDGRRR